MSCYTSLLSCIDRVSEKANPFPHAAKGEMGTACRIWLSRALLVILSVVLTIVVVVEVDQNDSCAYANITKEDPDAGGLNVGDIFTFACWQGSEQEIFRGSCPIDGYVTEFHPPKKFDRDISILFWNVIPDGDSGNLKTFEPTVNTTGTELSSPTGYNGSACSASLTYENLRTGTIETDACGLKGWLFENGFLEIWGFCATFSFSVFLLVLFEYQVLDWLSEELDDNVDMCTRLFWKGAIMGVKRSDPTSMPYSVKLIRFLFYSMWLSFPSALVTTNIGGCPTIVGGFHAMPWFAAQNGNAIALIGSFLLHQLTQHGELDKAWKKCLAHSFKVLAYIVVFANFFISGIIYFTLLSRSFLDISLPGINVPLTGWSLSWPTLVANRVSVLILGVIDMTVLILSLTATALCRGLHERKEKRATIPNAEPPVVEEPSQIQDSKERVASP
eukprot:gb/GECG01002433.1/.p1 GENE.gb/GECG01002433.1/~~gb/GECG01002433.1/.p1  ORF type:complete len:445 (+),score=21.35 gb/GECG01002433.1/:1-1335(+)